VDVSTVRVSGNNVLRVLMGPRPRKEGGGENSIMKCVAVCCLAKHD